MAFGTVMSATISGIHVEMIHVEADVSNGLPMFSMVGYLSSEVKEAGERVRTALKNEGFEYPVKKIIINLSPATIRKRGAIFDLPIAISIMISAGQIPQEKVKNILIVGELGLDGKVLNVNGILAMVMEAKASGITTCIVPKENEEEGRLVEGVKVYGFSTTREVYNFLLSGKDKVKGEAKGGGKEEARGEAKEEARGEAREEARGEARGEAKKEFKGVNIAQSKKGVSGKTERVETNTVETNTMETNTVDFSDIFGQKAVKRAAEIAVAGGHNLLLIGPPGSGKSLIARAIPTILPSLENHESMEITKIYSIMGLLRKGKPLITSPPFRAVHHTATKTSLVGGGKIPRIGEITLAHKGILYLDELPEFTRAVIEVLRQPLEDKSIQITRTSGTYVFPADFILVCAMNPCPCGMYPNLEKCSCSPSQIQKYLGKISQPFLDRIDLCVEVPRLRYEDLKEGGRGESGKGESGKGENGRGEEIKEEAEKGEKGKEEERKGESWKGESGKGESGKGESGRGESRREESSEEVRKRVVEAREIQRERYLDSAINGSLSPKEVQKYCALDKEGEEIMERAYHKLHLTARSYHKILKVARTIADMDGCQTILPKHLREGIAYRTLDKKYWGGN